MKNNWRDSVICGVPVERQLAGSKIKDEIHQACEFIAEGLIKIWELWDLKKSNTYFYDISPDCIITFMQKGCMGDRATEAEWLFHHKTMWIQEVVSLTRNDIANPETFLSEHEGYRQKYDKYLLKLKTEMKQREKEERRLEFERLEKEFGAEVK